MDFPIDYNIGSLPMQAVNEMVCPKCGRDFVWYQTRVGEIGIGLEHPKCPYCGGNECRSKY